MWGRRRVPSNEVVVTQRVFVGDPIAGYQAGSVDALYGLGMAGRTGAAVSIGASSAPTWRFSGDGGPLQNFRGSLGGSSPAGVRAGFRQALPATAPPIADPNPLHELLRRTQPR